MSTNPQNQRTRLRTRGVISAAIVLLAGIVVYALTFDRAHVTSTKRDSQVETVQASASAGEETRRLNAILAATEDVWRTEFQRLGKSYRPPELVLVAGHADTPCGMAETETGPFYCAKDQKIYIDPAFFGELSSRLHAPGDFARTFVVAHEIGHHVQKLLGTFDRVEGQREHASDIESNQLSVRLELQADFLAGLWANRARKGRPDLVPVDPAAALRAAGAIGDDRLQKRMQGYDLPESFRHGTSEQRVRWFQRGFQSGDFSKGNTFSLPYDDL
jgi:uncharacterized protein